MSLLDEFSPTLHKNLFSRISHLSWKHRDIGILFKIQSFVFKWTTASFRNCCLCALLQHHSRILTNFMQKSIYPGIFNTVIYTFENEWCRSTLGNKILGLFMKTILLCWNSYSCSFFSSLILLFLKFCLRVFGSVKIRSPLFNRKRSMSTLEGNWSFFYWIYSCGSIDWFSFNCQEILRFSFQLDSDISELIVVSYLLQ